LRENGIHTNCDPQFYNYPAVYLSEVVTTETVSDTYLGPDARVLAFDATNQYPAWRNAELYTTTRRIWWVPVVDGPLPPPVNPRGGPVRMRAFPHGEKMNEEYRTRTAALAVGLVWSHHGDNKWITPEEQARKHREKDQADAELRMKYPHRY
jgi:hypothetical protein